MPSPEEAWAELWSFLAFGESDRQAMLVTVEALLKHAYPLVVETYATLQGHPETAAILGWERGADPVHLAERRRFFSVWLARTLGLDMSDDMARYLFRAGQLHAGHGPRAIHVPEVYVRGSLSLVFAAFARLLHEERSGNVTLALAGWHKLLTMHEHLMVLGYRSALAIDEGDIAVTVAVYGNLRPLLKAACRTVRVSRGAAVEDLLRKVFNYYPQARTAAFERDLIALDKLDHRGNPWLRLEPVYRLKPAWRVLVEGRDIADQAGLEQPLSPGVTVSIFPPGR
jgi:molybdopterin converting factor small subunit